MINKEFVTLQKNKIEKKITALERDLNHVSKYDDIGSTSEDEVQEFEEFEENTVRAKALTSEIKELKAALRRIKKGTYGVCEKCHGPIETARLRAFPQSRFCASDK